MDSFVINCPWCSHYSWWQLQCKQSRSSQIRCWKTQNTHGTNWRLNTSSELHWLFWKSTEIKQITILNLGKQPTHRKIKPHSVLFFHCCQATAELLTICCQSHGQLLFIVLGWCDLAKRVLYKTGERLQNSSLLRPSCCRSPSRPVSALIQLVHREKEWQNKNNELNLFQLRALKALFQIMQAA